MKKDLIVEVTDESLFHLSPDEQDNESLRNSPERVDSPETIEADYVCSNENAPRLRLDFVAADDGTGEQEWKHLFPRDEDVCAVFMTHKANRGSRNCNGRLRPIEIRVAGSLILSDQLSDCGFVSQDHKNNPIRIPSGYQTISIKAPEIGGFENGENVRLSVDIWALRESETGYEP